MEHDSLFTAEDIRYMLSQTKHEAVWVTGTNSSRACTLFNTESYNSASYRTTFFCIHGSPPKSRGMIFPLEKRFKMVTTVGTYYFLKSGQRVTLRDLHMP